MKWILAWVAQKNRLQSELTRRANYGLLAAVIGVGSNLLLFVSKIVIGLISGSIAIITDAVNNLSDVLSAFVAMIGFKAATKKPDHIHPFGHERSETISGFIIAIIIAFVGIQLIESSIRKIINPVSVHYSFWIYLILMMSILLKLWQVFFYHQIDRMINSQTLNITAKDSLNDVYTTTAVLVSAGIQNYTDWRLDGYVGLAVAIYILVSAILMMRSFINDLLGEQPPVGLIDQITAQLETYQDILGYHDLIIHEYGPHSIFASVHIELDSAWTLDQAHQVLDRIEHHFQYQQGIHLVCHLDPIDIRNQESARIYEVVQAVIEHYQLGLKTHDFHIKVLANDDYLIQFDVVVPEKVTIDDDELLVSINRDLRKLLGDVTAEITFDHNYIIEDHTLI